VATRVRSGHWPSARSRPVMPAPCWARRTARSRTSWSNRSLRRV
jgi:hypothetical protein